MKIEGEKIEAKRQNRKKSAAVTLGRLGGLKGGKARTKKLSAQKRRTINRRACLSD